MRQGACAGERSAWVACFISFHLFCVFEVIFFSNEYFELNTIEQKIDRYLNVRNMHSIGSDWTCQ